MDIYDDQMVLQHPRMKISSRRMPSHSRMMSVKDVRTEGSLCHLYRNVHHVFDTMLNAYAYSVYICTLYMYNVNYKNEFLHQ